MEEEKGHFNTDIPEKVVAARPEKGIINEIIIFKIN